MSDVAKITLGGQEFDIPEPPLRVMRKIWPITARMAKRSKNNATLDPASGKPIYSFDATEESIDDAIELVFLGINFGKPSFTREDMENLVADLSEVIAASIIVTIQSGGKKMGERMEAAKQEMMATPPAVTQAPPTGTESSPTSVETQDGNGTTSTAP